MRSPRSILVALVLLATLGGTVSASAQSLWLEPQTGKGVVLEILRPGIKDADLTFFSRTYYLTGRFAAGEKATFLVEVPYAHVAGNNYDVSESGFGNIYLGGEIGPRTSGFRFDFGVRIPTVPADNNTLSVAGAFSDYVDRAEAFVPEVFTGLMALRYRHLARSGFGLDVRMAPVVWFDTSGERSDGTEGWLLMSIQTWAELEKLALGLGYSNRILLTEDDRSLQERTLEQVVFFANLRFGAWRPGLQVRLPLDEDLQEALDPTVALSVGYDF